MVLKSDCIRDVLIAVEKLQRYSEFEDTVVKEDFYVEALYAALPQYSKQDVFYTLFTLDQAGLVDISVQWSSGCVVLCAINYLTFSGHEFLEKIRDDGRWHGIKKALPSIRNYSLAAINAISEGMTSGAISAYLAKNP